MFETFRKQQTLTLFAAGSVFVGAMMGTIATTGTARSFSILAASASVGAIGATAYAGQRISYLEEGIKADLEKQRANASLRAEIAELELRETKAGLESEAEKNKELLALIEPLEQEREQLKARYQDVYDRYTLAKKELAEGIAEIKSDYQQKLEKTREELQQQFEDAKLANNTRITKAAKSYVQQERARLEKTLKEKEEALYNECLAKIKKYKSEHRQREQFLLEEIDRIEQESVSQNYNLQALVHKLKGDCTELLEALEGWIQQSQTWKDTANQQFVLAMQSTEHRHQQEVQRLYGQISDFLKPKRLASRDKASHTANLVADWFLQRQVIVDVEDAIGFKDRDVVFIKPRLHTLEELKKFSTLIWQEFELTESPEFQIENGCIKISLFTAEAIDDSVSFKERKPKENAVASVRASDGTEFEIFAAVDKLRHYIRNCERWHFFVNGDSGAGKDALVNNIVNLIYQEMAADGVEVEIVIIDGKDPNDSPVIINGKEIEPQYGGIRDAQDEDEGYWSDDPDCLEGLQAMRRDVLSSLQEMKARKKRGQEWKPTKKTIYICTEAEEMIAAYDSGNRRPASRAMLTTARLGRSLGKAIIVVGQSPNAASYNFLIANLNNFVRVYLRENAFKGSKETIPTAEQRKPIARAISYLTKQSEGLPDGTPEKYWGMWKLPGEPAFMAYSPAPNIFSFKPALPSSEAIQPQEPIEFSREVPKPAAEELLDLIEARSALLEEDEQEFLRARLSQFARVILEKTEEKGLHDQSLTASYVRNYFLKSQCDNPKNKLDVNKIRRLFSELARNGFGETESKGKSLCWKLPKTGDSSIPDADSLDDARAAG